jgi:CrcB protein
MLKNFLLVGLGGAVGSMLRYAVAQIFRTVSFPAATFLVNVLGCFLIGIVIAVSLRNQSFEQNWRLFLATGICGGFTTFSAFAAEGMALLQEQRIGLYLIYVAGSILLGLLATWLGYSWMK